MLKLPQAQIIYLFFSLPDPEIINISIAQASLRKPPLMCPLDRLETAMHPKVGKTL